MTKCLFCHPNVAKENILLENSFCLFLQREEMVLVGSGLIIPRTHRETAFDLTTEEWQATLEILMQAKIMIDNTHHPSGYNLGWNCGATAGQEIFHTHLHVIPRYSDEPLAGKGIRYWLKQENNLRNR